MTPLNLHTTPAGPTQPPSITDAEPAQMAAVLKERSRHNRRRRNRATP